MDDFFKLFSMLVSFAAAMILAQFIAKTRQFSFIDKRKNRLSSLDGLRGFLALSVFFHHFMLTWYWKTTDYWGAPQETFIQNFGKVSVALFFMITGFLFSSKLINNQNTINWRTLYKSRLCRIYPLYLFALGLISLIVFIQTGFNLTVSTSELTVQYMQWLFFQGGDINNLTPTRRIISGVDWTLKYEWLFYFSLPFLAVVLLKLRKVGILIGFIVSLYLFLYPQTIHSLNTRYFILFYVGIITALITHSEQFKFNWVQHKLSSLLSSTLIIICLFYPHTLDLFHLGMISLLFFNIAAGNTVWGLLSKRAAIILGEISYSIYLLHGIILYSLFTLQPQFELNKINLYELLLLLPLITLLVVSISAITFIKIEKPFIRIGYKEWILIPTWFRKGVVK